MAEGESWPVHTVHSPREGQTVRRLTFSVARMFSKVKDNLIFKSASCTDCLTAQDDMNNAVISYTCYAYLAIQKSGCYNGNHADTFTALESIDSSLPKIYLKNVRSWIADICLIYFIYIIV